MGGRRAWRTIRSPPTPQACTADAHPSPPSFAAMEIDVFAPLAATAVPPVQFPGPDGPAPPIAQSRVRRMRSVPLPDGNAMAIARLLQDHERRIWRVLRLLLLGQGCPGSHFSILDVDTVRHIARFMVAEMVAIMDAVYRNDPKAAWSRLLR